MQPAQGITMRQLLEAGVHFGHQTKRWNPKMKPYIFGARNGIYIVDLQKTVRLAREAFKFVSDICSKGGSVLFVGTKKQAQDAVIEESTRSGQFHVTNRWLGGTLTNFKTIKSGIDRLKALEKMAADGTFEKLPKKEVAILQNEMDKLKKNRGGERRGGRGGGRGMGFGGDRPRRETSGPDVEVVRKPPPLVTEGAEAPPAAAGEEVQAAAAPPDKE